MRLGWNWKSATTALIYKSLFNLRAESLGAAGTGKMVNLISNDVGRFEDYSVFMIFFPVSLLEALAVMVYLIYQLNVASAVAAVGLTALLIPVQLHLAKLFAKIRSKTAAETDKRVRHVSEVIDGK
jgi:ABC-type transport system involved in cytochrome bd biosynthesis fused ATPase/permease subunit